MKRFLQRRARALLVAIAFFGLLISCQPVPQAESSPTASPPANQATEISISPAQLPPLPYDYAALEPHIDAATMKLHHDRHHATYVENINSALKDQPNLQNQSLEALLRNLNNVPENIRTQVRNNGGGHYNHTMFWQIMAPNAGGEPTGAIAEQINKSFGNFEAFRKQFNDAGRGVFGSGWVWLVRNQAGELEITITPNQDSPIMNGQYPIMGNDVWEHAYYLNYQNRRPEYLDAWWNVVNWNEVNRRLQLASQQN